MIRIAFCFVATAVALPLSAQMPATPAPAAPGLTTQATAKSYAQSLVDTTVARHPELIELDLHATPPGSSQSVIVAAKAANRIGKKSDPDDLEVFKTGAPRIEINRIGDYNVEVELPLLDANRKTIGSVELTFPYVAGFDQEALIKKAEGIRDELATQISNVAALVEPGAGDSKAA